ncbi:Kif3b, partial [Symbiodinium sp. KB8]
DGTSWRSQIGHVTRIGPEGRSRLHPGAKHPSPIASAGKVGLPSAPSAHRDGYADPKDRGPRFSTLPPPPDKPYTPHYGALQPALRSRLDNTQDIRLEGSMGEVLPETADTICFVPEPYVRAQRPDQRVRSTAALSDSEAISDTLEKAGIWFRPVPTREEHFREMSDDELRERLRDVAELVSGSRRDLLKRLYSKKSNFTSWTKAEVETECYRLGLEVLEKKADNVVNIKNAQEWQQIRNLSDEDLAYELSYRGLDSEDRKSDEEYLQKPGGDDPCHAAQLEWVVALTPWRDHWSAASALGALAPLSRSGVSSTEMNTRQAEFFDQPDEYFRVVIRVRPPLDRELSSPVWQHVVSVTGTSQICLYETIAEMNPGDRASGTSQVVNTHTFTFDHVYDQVASQPEVYTSTARSSVMSALDGYNTTILAYGPTGTGKTYTMEGCQGQDGHGIIPRSMEDIFQHIQEAQNGHASFQVRASYLQIYNEVISDLLKPDRSHLMIREDRRKGVFVEGLSEWLCRSPDEVQTLMEHGSSARATAQTGANDTSSRSHAVFIIVVEHETVEGKRTGRLNLVDLAGSERPRLTGATGQRLEETKKINQSLSALGNVISALTERRGPVCRPHVPYRDSKLTRLLEDSLGGNCRTTMMAMVSPAAEAFAESLSTLKFAQRAKGVVTTPQVNEDLDPRTLTRRYEAEIRRLRSELAERSQEVKRSIGSDFPESFDRHSLPFESMAPLRTDLAGSRASSVSAARELTAVEDDKAQVGRYKQLLLKQRDIMIALTQRLHERDETIIALQAELDARDRHLNELMQRGERQALRLAAAEKALQASSKANLTAISGGVARGSAATSGPGLFPRQPPPVAVQTALPEAPPSPKASSPRAAELEYLPRYLPESRLDSPTASDRSRRAREPSTAGPGLLSADDKVLELTSLLEAQRQENHRMKLELETMQDSMLPLHGASVASTMANSFSPDVPVQRTDLLGRFRDRQPWTKPHNVSEDVRRHGWTQPTMKSDSYRAMRPSGSNSRSAVWAVSSS